MTYNLIIAKRPEGVTLAEAMAWGLPVETYPYPCSVFEDKYGGGEMRDVGVVMWHRGKQQMVPHVRVDAGPSDLVTVLSVARRLRAPRSDWNTNPRGVRSIGIARPLADYGDDIALVARVEDYVPAAWAAGPMPRLAELGVDGVVS